MGFFENLSKKASAAYDATAEKTGKLTQRDTIRRDIDTAIKASVTQQQFIRTMEVMGYEFKLWTSTGERLKYPSIKPPGAKGFFRFHKLGEEYDLPRIVQRIRNNKIVIVVFLFLFLFLVSCGNKEIIFKLEKKNSKNFIFYKTDKSKTYTKGKLNGSFKRVKPKGIYALYLRYCYELGIIKKNPTSVKRVSFLLF